jgi:hypothetical protein
MSEIIPRKLLLFAAHIITGTFLFVLLLLMALLVRMFAIYAVQLGQDVPVYTVYGLDFVAYGIVGADIVFFIAFLFREVTGFSDGSTAVPVWQGDGR